MGLGLNLGTLPVNPALVAAALNQAGWNLINNLQNPPEPTYNQNAGGGGGFSNGSGNVNSKWIWMLIVSEFFLFTNGLECWFDQKLVETSAYLFLNVNVQNCL